MPGRNSHRAYPAQRPRRGATILEMALTLGILLSLSFGTVEFGYFFFVKNTVQGAAREGARVAITPTASNSDVTAMVNRALTAAGLRPGDFTTTVKVAGTVANCNTATAGQPVEVSVQGTWGTVGLRPIGIIGSTKAVVGAATMRKEGS
jgi:Flp pilus assembly protein TadG